MAPLRFLSEPGGPETGTASESERQLRTVVSAVTAGIVFKGPAGEILDFNPAAARILGVSRDPATGEIVSDPRLQAVREDGTPYPLDEWPAKVALRTGAPVRNGIMGFASPDAPTRWVRLHAVPLARPGSPPHAVVVSLDDITEERRAQIQLRQADRLASIGTLAAGVAHEVNNPLACVQSGLQFVAEALHRPAGDPGRPSQQELDAAIREALDGVARVKGIVQGLQLFAGPPRASARRPIDPRMQIEAAVALARNEIQARARLEVTLADPLPRIQAADLEVTQVVVSLLVNAAQAIPEGRPADHLVALSAATRDGRLVIAVRDTGVGIAAPDLPRIFDPFYTTRPFQGGHGLGLPICHGLVGALGGSIDVESTPGRGTTFHVRLPVTAPAPAPRAAPVPAPAAGPRARVLILDDEPLVARSLARALQSTYDVTTLTSAGEALRRIRGGEAWDVILCDVMMPEMSAMELEEALSRERPELVGRLLYVTGGAFTDRSREFLATRPHVEKPVDFSFLRAAVAERIQGGAAGSAGASGS